MADLKYKRILLKLSGEVFGGEDKKGIDFEEALEVAREIADVQKMGVEIAIVVGGGNLFRGYYGTREGMDQVTGDYIGMIGTVMNALALQNAIETYGVETRVMSALDINKVAEPYIRRRASRHMEKGRIVICASGSGNPFFTTDTAGVLRAAELGCEVMLKASNIDGVYDCDPKENSEAKKFEKLSYDEVVQKELRALDLTATTLAKERKLPIVVFDFHQKNSLKKVVEGEKIGTEIS